MPTLSLLTPIVVPDASHKVTAPGGYEWWYFDAEDTTGELRMVAIFFQGFVFHPAYLRAYGKFRRSPTRNAPPLPAEFPCVYFVLYRRSQIVGQFMSQQRSEEYSAADDRVDVSIGLNRLTSSPSGELDLHLKGVPWTLTGRGPVTHETQRLLADFRFSPRFTHEPMQRRFFSRSWSGADHQWVIANPLCDVTGEVEIYDVPTKKETKFRFTGRGYHDHNYGTGPIGPGLKRWMWGRVLMNDHALMFHFAQPKNSAQADDVHMIEAEALGLREVAVDRFHADWSRKTSTLLRYPAWVEAGPLQLANPRVIDASPFYLRLVYDASVRGVTAQAFCEIAYPHRLRWPILGRMIEMSIRRG